MQLQRGVKSQIPQAPSRGSQSERWAQKEAETEETAEGGVGCNSIQHWGTKFPVPGCPAKVHHA